MTGSLASTYSRWGIPAETGEEHSEEHGESGHLPPRTAELIAELLGPPFPAGSGPALAVADIEPPASRLSAADAEALADAIGGRHVSVEREDRLAHAAGMSYLDLIAKRTDAAFPAPDAVAFPASHAEVVRLLAACAARGIAVVPFGGGTSVVGGVSPGSLSAAEGSAPRIAIGMRRMADLLDVDPISGTATVQPGITGPTLERMLEARGFTWGHVPQSWERATVGGYVATRSAGQASTGYGRSDSTIEALKVATPHGEFTLGRGPSTAAGPDLRQVFIGSEGTLGVITEIRIRIRPLPAAHRMEAVMLPSWDAGLAAFRAMAQHRVTADIMRLSDSPETETTLRMNGPTGRTAAALDAYLKLRRAHGGCIAILGWDGNSQRHVSARRRESWGALRAVGGVSLGSGPGESWLRHRFSAPYLRDALMDAGYLVETLETATTWTRMNRLRDATYAALRESLASDGGRAHVMGHVSHVYPTGASLYITVVADARDPHQQAKRWTAAKAAATEAIVAAGGTITHHHAVGRDHAPWLGREVGESGVDLLRAIKSAVDPQGILNPGVLIPGLCSPELGSPELGSPELGSPELGSPQPG